MGQRTMAAESSASARQSSCGQRVFPSSLRAVGSHALPLACTACSAVSRCRVFAWPRTTQQRKKDGRQSALRSTLEHLSGLVASHVMLPFPSERQKSSLGGETSILVLPARGVSRGNDSTADKHPKPTPPLLPLIPTGPTAAPLFPSLRHPSPTSLHSTSSHDS